MYYMRLAAIRHRQPPGDANFLIAFGMNWANVPIVKVRYALVVGGAFNANAVCHLVAIDLKKPNIIGNLLQIFPSLFNKSSYDFFLNARDAVSWMSNY